MASRSTRNKIRWHAERMIDCVRNCQSQLKAMDELAAGQSEVVSIYVPILLESFTNLETLCIQVRDQL